MENTSGWKPLRHCFLVQMSVEETKSTGGIILSTGSDRQRQQIATVVEIGDMCWEGEVGERILPGDKVMVSRYCGSEFVGKDDQIYRFINDNEVFAKEIV